MFCPKTTKFCPKLAFLFIANSFGALLVGWLVVVVQAVSRKTPIYFINYNGIRNVLFFFLLLQHDDDYDDVGNVDNFTGIMDDH